MASAKRAASKGKSTASKKGHTGRKVPSNKAARKAAPASKAAAKTRKPAARPAANRPAAKPGPATSAKKTPAKSKTSSSKPTARPEKAKATKVPVPVVREMVVRTTPGLVKTSGRRKTPAPSRKARRALEAYDPNALIHGIRPYQPQAGEAYMSSAQLKHFKEILLAWKRELMEEVDRTVHHMQDEASNFPDPNDRATQESEFGLELRTRDRERKLLKKISAGIERIDDGSYGYCEETGEEIGLKRLEARPVATLSLEAQERREMSERQYGERDDRYR